jgi:hypothetical protein
VTEIPRHSSSPDPIEWFRPFVEADSPGVFVVRSTDNVTGARPRDGAEAHGARFSAGNQLVGWLPFSAEIEVFNGALREHDRRYLGVSNGAVCSDNEVYAEGHEPVGIPVEDRYPQRSSGFMLHVDPGKPDKTASDPRRLGMSHPGLLGSSPPNRVGAAQPRGNLSRASFFGRAVQDLSKSPSRVNKNLPLHPGMLE